MFKTFLLFLYFLNLYSFNISNLNDFKKNTILSNINRFSSLYTLNSVYGNTKSNDNTISTIQDSHTLDNNLFFYAQIDQDSSLSLEQRLLALNHHNLNMMKKYQIELPPIHLHIQSFGGSLFHTLYLVDLIKNLETPVYTYVDGFAASAATLLSISGKKRFISKNSLMLIHQLSGGNAGKYSELKDESENLDVLMDFIINHYLTNTKMTKFELGQILRRDIWLNSSTCLRFGLVDEIL